MNVRVEVRVEGVPEPAVAAPDGLVLTREGATVVARAEAATPLGALALLDPWLAALGRAPGSA